jgi:hypothetical protein
MENEVVGRSCWVSYDEPGLPFYAVIYSVDGNIANIRSTNLKNRFSRTLDGWSILLVMNR